VAGETRFGTAALVAALAESQGATAASITLASGAEFADALVAGPVVARERALPGDS